MKLLLIIFVFTAAFIYGCANENKQLTDEQLKEKAKELAHKFIIVDGHVDIPYRLQGKWEDISQRTESGDFDYVRAKEGGLDAPFMSIFVPSSYEGTGKAKDFADKLIDSIYAFAERWPDKFAVAVLVDDVKKQFAQGLISLPMGMENGSPIEEDLSNVQYFYNRGIRYITLAHSRNNHICDSSYDPERKWNGLSPFGEQLVKEMNRVGIMVDVSHISDSAFYDVIRISEVPVIASHSSCRHFTPGWERNMSDEMIVELAKNGGIIMINFGSSFLKKEVKEGFEHMSEHIRTYLRENDLKRDDPIAQEYIRQYREEHHPGFADITDVADHIDHVVNLVGIDHVGLGSDFDGVGNSLPEDLKDAFQIPNLIFHLLKRGYSENDIEKICSGNIFRVWRKVEMFAEKHR